MSDKENSKTNLRIGPVLLSYVYVANPKYDEKKKKDFYSVKVLFDKSDAKIQKQLKSAIQHAAIKKFGLEKAKKLLKHPQFKLPVRDPEAEDLEGDEYKGRMFFNPSKSEKRPGLVLRNGTKLTDPDEIQDQFYSGVLAYVTINAYGFSGESKGVAIGLNNILKWADGERLDGFSNVDDDFGDMFDDDIEGVDNLGDDDLGDDFDDDLDDI